MNESNPDYAIHTEGLSRSFSGFHAVANLNLRVPKGSIYGFLGRNGAGKTTAIKMLAGLIKPESGSVRVLDREPMAFTVEDRQRIGYLSEKQILPNLSATTLIDFCRPLYPRWDQDLVQRLLASFRIDPRKKIMALSQGAQRQVAFILALAPRPDLVILDEPASTLDVVARREILDEILALVREGGPTVFLSSHILSDIERVADHIGIMVDGTLKVSEPLDDLKDNFRKVRFHSANRDLATLELPHTLHRQVNGREALFTLRRADESELARAALAHGAQFEIQSLNLEDIFVEISRRN